MTEHLKAISGDQPTTEAAASENIVHGQGVDAHLQAGFELDVTHDDDAAYICFRVRLPREGALKWLMAALGMRDAGLNRMGGEFGKK